jgi:NAD(P)-dependent dehydrogenase (short-subunit alcohol dehydrogenase family)
MLAYFISDQEVNSAMDKSEFKSALIVGAGAGLSASLARAFAHDGIAIALASRSTDDLAALVRETGARAFPCDASKRSDVERLFAELDAAPGAPDIVIYNASFRTRGPLIDLDPTDVERTLAVTAFGAFLVAQQAARRMLPNGHGAILFTGASAGVKGYPQSAPFAMGKFALRGLAQSMARELHPQGVHVAHIVVDGGIKSARRAEPPDKPASMLDPDAVAATYLHVIQQPRSAWSSEVEVRPWVEKF